MNHVLFCEWLDANLNVAYVSWLEDGQGMITWVDDTGEGS